MEQEVIKLELIEWLAKLEDKETIEYLKLIKDSWSSGHDWWNDLCDDERASIERGINDIEKGRTTPHEVVKKKYGL